jgi:hypothetical protein
VIEGNRAHRHPGPDAGAREKFARDAEAGAVHFDLAILRVHHAEAGPVFFLRLQTEILLREHPAGDVVRVQILSPIDDGAFAFAAIGRVSKRVDPHFT